MSWLTFWSWRGAHHGKATRRAVQAQSAQQLGIERARWAIEHPDAPLPHAMLTVSERNRVALAGQAGAWHPGLWWTVLVLAVAVACTVIGIPVALVMAVPLWAYSPYRGRAVADCGIVDPDPPTVPLVTVPDPVQTYRLADAGSSHGRHAR